MRIIDDFTSGVDYVGVTAADFGGVLVKGAAVALVTAPDAANAITGGPAGAYFIYAPNDPSNGPSLWVDLTGGDSGDAVELAYFRVAPTLTAADIVLL